jgi:hypothetical protein
MDPGMMPMIGVGPIVGCSYLGKICMDSRGQMGPAANRTLFPLLKSLTSVRGWRCVTHWDGRSKVNKEIKSAGIAKPGLLDSGVEDGDIPRSDFVHGHVRDC